ncbi:MarR family winged helix-turn-helix transcriptional regulator [Nocardioides marmorisolisilvae]|uniref:MarR family transcriptional regulator n=1 Tax=Nocardioides marmorisolisilvae TaxID=1542737 RepID=A0A3N0DT21_9ACTN|nr:MarR family transcriptional regulator [Nocardioides marmorisolisilvae]RNL78762.1 MarR family transcriptional regulator [Nocardioides marmorisolisilvae]
MSPTETRWLDADQQATWRAFIVGSTLLMDTLDRELRQEHDISLGEYEILVRLSESPDRTLRMAKIAESMRHSRSRVTHTVSRMEKDGLIRRIAATDDKRGVDAIMTDKGWELLQAAAHTHVSGVRAHFVDLADRADYAALGRVMNSVSDQLVAENPTFEDIR